MTFALNLIVQGYSISFLKNDIPQNFKMLFNNITFYKIIDYPYIKKKTNFDTIFIYNLTLFFGYKFYFELSFTLKLI